MPNIFLSCLPFLGRFCPKLKFQKYLDWINVPLSQRYQGTSSYLTPALKKYLYNPDFLDLKSSYLEDQFSRYFHKVRGRTPLSQMLYVDTKTWLVDDLLVKADKMTMAASIELRVPFLDYRLIEAATALSDDLKIRKGEGKYLLKKIAGKKLPQKIIYREKRGFPVPTREWLQDDRMDYVEDVIFKLKQEPWFQAKTLDKLIARHRAGTEDHSKILMTLLVFAEWQRQYG
jgi:asparagine synthase (glutamine-hydrolysing)